MRPTQSLVDDLARALRGGAQLSLAVLFGSGARGELREDSDVDVAILPLDELLPLSVELALQATLARAARRDVDVVRLDRASTLVKWQVARHGVPLLQSGPFAFARFVAHATSEYLELAPALAWAGERFRQQLTQRAREGA